MESSLNQGFSWRVLNVAHLKSGLEKEKIRKRRTKTSGNFSICPMVFFGEGLKYREGFSGVELKNSTPTKKQLFF